ncbi:hypothetical protein V8F06_002111 [Rhypophila decipiens]
MRLWLFLLSLYIDIFIYNAQLWSSLEQKCGTACFAAKTWTRLAKTTASSSHLFSHGLPLEVDTAPMLHYFATLVGGKMTDYAAHCLKVKSAAINILLGAKGSEIAENEMWYFVALSTSVC